MRGAIQTSSAKTGGRDDFCTPPAIIERLREGWLIDLDPCTNAHSMTAPLRGALFGSPDDDGLTADWSTMVDGGITFVNPPYSAAAAWAAKMAKEARAGVPVVALVASRTDTRWWSQLWPHVDACAFWRGRIRFWLDGAPATAWSKKLQREVPASATFASAFLGINVSQRRFREVFAAHATVVVP